MSNKTKAGTEPSSWWGYAQSAWTSIQETAKDFQESIISENKDTITKIKENVNQQTITDQISNATNSINTLLNYPNTEDMNDCKVIVPQPFEQEKATYTSDPLKSNDKQLYLDFLSENLSDTTDEKLCLNGRKLLLNNAIRVYFDLLIPKEINEITFWKRYFFWKHQTELRLDLMASIRDDDDAQLQIDQKNDDHQQTETDEISLGDNIIKNMDENAKLLTEQNATVHNAEVTVDLTDRTQSSDENGGKFSETSWTDVIPSNPPAVQINSSNELNEIIETVTQTTNESTDHIPSDINTTPEWANWD